MKLRITLYIGCFFALLFIVSCTSYKTINPEKILEDGTQRNTYQSFDLNDFDVYAFNICEYYSNLYNGTNRFVDCPKDFFNVTARDSIKKVEELYFLKHQKSNLVVYLTTFSHKYIRAQSGFLNQLNAYKNKIYLKDIEYVYLGEINDKQDSIVFKNQKDASKMIWHLPKPITSSSTFIIEDVNIETVENTNNFDEKIALENVFSIPFNFEKTDYDFFDKINIDKQKSINKFFLVNNKKDKVEVLFGSQDLQKGYRYKAKKVLFATNKWF